MTQIQATYIDHMGSDLSVVNAARVSFGKKSAWVEGHNGDHPSIVPVLSDKDTKLIRYLAKHKHISPFGHAFASFHVKAPIFVARQLVKHKFLRWNEISRRYVDDTPEFYRPETWRGRSEDKKQGSSDVVITELEDAGYTYDPDFGSEWYEEVYGVNESLDNWERYCLNYYDLLLRNDVAPEQARMILPQSTMTEWHWSGSLDAFASMCQLRCKTDTQYESRLVADQISEKMGALFPVSWAALMESNDD